MQTVTAFIVACHLMASANTNVPSETLVQVCESIEYHGASSGIDKSTLVGMVWVESRFDPNAVSSANARGVMQVILGRGWSLDYSEDDMLDPWLSVEAGILMALRFIRFNKVKWIECYNAGVSCDAPRYLKAVQRASRRFLRIEKRVRSAWE